MKYRHFDKLGIDVSVFGLGCMRLPMIEKDGKKIVDRKISDRIIREAIEGGVNYFDTAYVYSEQDNEAALAHALRGGLREKVYIATKLPIFKCESSEDFERMFCEQLERLETDHIDFYLVHSLSGEQWDKAVSLGICEFLDKLKREGRIRYACFSVHDDYAAFERIIKAYDWDMCQIQFNYMDVENQAGVKGLRLAGELGIPVVIMEGLRGGRLATVPSEVREVFDSYNEHRTDVEWAFKFIADFQEVMTILSGVTDTEQLHDNIRIFSELTANSMTNEEHDIIKRAADAYMKRIKVGCTGCKYCMPCPNGVSIPDIFTTWNNAFRYGTTLGGNQRYARMKNQGNGADKCIQCGACEGACPQHINIIEMLRVADSELS